MLAKCWWSTWRKDRLECSRETNCDHPQPYGGTSHGHCWAVKWGESEQGGERRWTSSRDQKAEIIASGNIKQKKHFISFIVPLGEATGPESSSFRTAWRLLAHDSLGRTADLLDSWLCIFSTWVAHALTFGFSIHLLMQSRWNAWQQSIEVTL